METTAVEAGVQVFPSDDVIDYRKIEHYMATIDTGICAGSWAVSKTSALDAINRVVRIAKEDWKIYGKGYVNVYDVTHSDRFTTEGHPKDIKTGKHLPYLYSVSVDIPKSKRR